MKYYIDTEFIEGFHKPMFGKRRHFIDLISIGIVAEDGRKYYAISNEFDPNDADQWVKDNVISRLPERYERGSELLYKSNAQIKQEIIEFVYPIKQMANYYYVATGDNPTIIDWQTLEISDKAGRLPFTIFDEELKPELDAYKPEFYAYYADYDWVLFCSLFGRMIDLPKGFPMYCIDLKQILDEKAASLTAEQASRIAYPGVSHNVFTYLDSTKDKSFKLDALKASPAYPKQGNEHNALDDAIWNKQLHEFLNNLLK